ncbi:unnamed protein product [Calicophoron daubneyi]|uniref:Uncharacterized protein n=1 Tax=Calicophoron daubneyi TaxID=300641 RepID=A0AAV2SXW3_CALDB
MNALPRVMEVLEHQQFSILFSVTVRTQPDESNSPAMVEVSVPQIFTADGQKFDIKIEPGIGYSVTSKPVTYHNSEDERTMSVVPPDISAEISGAKTEEYYSVDIRTIEAIRYFFTNEN